jgi:hypothetical protein
MTYIDPHGRVWRPFAVDYETSDGTFRFEIMAISHLHAEEMLADIKNSAKVTGEIVHTEDA